MIMCDFVILWNLPCNTVGARHLIRLSKHLPQREFYLKNAVSSSALNVDRFFLSSWGLAGWLESQDQIPVRGVKTRQAQIQWGHHSLAKFFIPIRQPPPYGYGSAGCPYSVCSKAGWRRYSFVKAGLAEDPMRCAFLGQKKVRNHNRILFGGPLVESGWCF